MYRLFVGGNCNLACVICPYSDEWGKTRTLKEIERELNDKYDEILVHGGEIFEHPRHWDVITIAKEHSDVVGVRTNAVWLFDYERARFLSELVDYVYIYAPAHYEHAHTRITSTMRVFPIAEKGMLNVRAQKIPVRVHVPITKYTADEPLEYIEWVSNVLGDTIEGVTVSHWPVSEKALKNTKIPVKKEDIENFVPRYIDAEPLINLLAEYFGRKEVVVENIPPCFVRDYERARFTQDEQGEFSERCTRCILKGHECKGIPRFHMEMHGERDGYAPVLYRGG